VVAKKEVYNAQLGCCQENFVHGLNAYGWPSFALCHNSNFFFAWIWLSANAGIVKMNGGASKITHEG